ncbi:MAG: hypothetical protein V7K71_04070 [Nostoc sp.]|uniref:hypothetical protein n=1 Tax=Nostoc sp. TaxID=1180 RepID=UPI002FF58114
MAVENRKDEMWSILLQHSSFHVFESYLNGTKLRYSPCLTGSQPPGWESILGGSASSGLTRGRASGNTFPV